jgi:hypothetical protein
VIGGDFNTNHDQEMFAAEKTLDSLIGAGYENGFEEWPLSQRITHPGTHGFPDATFGYVFTRDYSRSHHAVILVYDDVGNLVETHEHKGDFKEW